MDSSGCTLASAWAGNTTHIQRERERERERESERGGRGRERDFVEQFFNVNWLNFVMH